MTRLRFTPAARADLDAIWDCTVANWGTAQAERYLSTIRDICGALAEGQHPDRDAAHIRPGLRSAPAGSHIVFFRRAADSTVEVIRILHRRMDIDRHQG